MKLYMNEMGTTSRAVLAFLEETGLVVVLKSIDLNSGEHHQPGFAMLNPNRLVPVLEDGGFVLTESSAILRYLAAKTKSPLYPETLKERARVDELIAWFEANFYRDFGFQYVYPQIFPHHSRGSKDADEAMMDFAKANSERWLAILDSHYLGNGRPYLAGDDLTIADFHGASILSLAEFVGFGLDAYPNVRSWYRRIAALPAWQRANRTFNDVTAPAPSSPRLDIPRREGARPQTSDDIPHRQVSDNPDPALHTRMKQRFLALKGTETGASLISVPGATALFVPGETALNPAAAMKGREFAHIHPEGDGSFHMVLDPDDAECVLERGWGEQHPWARLGKIPANNLMIYAPRDEAELETVMQIAAAARRYATLPSGDACETARDVTAVDRSAGQARAL